MHHTLPYFSTYCLLMCYNFSFIYLSLSLSLTLFIMETNKPVIFNPTLLTKNPDTIPTQLIWSEPHRPTPDSFTALADLPIINLRRFFSGDEKAAMEIADQVRMACEKYGVFQVADHGVDEGLIKAAERMTEEFFTMSLEEKERMRRRDGESSCYSSSAALSCNMPWKEMLRLEKEGVEEYFVKRLGEEFRQCGVVLQNYIKAMDKLSLDILEVLALSLGVGSSIFRDFYANNESIFMANYYPCSPKPDLTLGTGPHFDPNSITILHQDDNVDGLQVCNDGKWSTVSPKPNTFVINIGDTFMAQTNKRYKSCMHRAVVNSTTTRKSLVYFVSPEKDKIIRPSEKLVDADHPRAYPDFTWGMLQEFIQKYYMADSLTLTAFAEWLEKKDESGNEIDD